MYLLKCNLRTDTKALSPLQTAAKLTGILPFNLQVGAKNYHFFAFIKVLFILSIYSFSTYGKVLKSKEVEASVYILDLGNDIVLTIANLSAIIGINIVNGTEIQHFLQNLRDVDKELCTTKSKQKGSFRMFFEFTLFHLFYILYYIYTAYVWISAVGFDLFKYFMFRDVQYYHMLVLVVLLRYYVLTIKFRFEVINEILINITRENNKGISAIEEYTDKKWTMPEIMNIYNKMSNIVEEFNDIFGWMYLVLYVVIVVNLLAPVNIILTYGNGELTMNGVRFGFTLISFCIAWTLIPAVIGISLFTSCHNGAKEASRTSTICYNLTNDLNKSEIPLKEDLQKLANQVTSKPPVFSSGFFTINHSILFSLTGSVTSYLIVIIQLKT